MFLILVQKIERAPLWPGHIGPQFLLKSPAVPSEALTCFWCSFLKFLIPIPNIVKLPLKVLPFKLQAFLSAPHPKRFCCKKPYGISKYLRAMGPKCPRLPESIFLDWVCSFCLKKNLLTSSPKLLKGPGRVFFFQFFFHSTYFVLSFELVFSCGQGVSSLLEFTGCHDVIWVVFLLEIYLQTWKN